MTPVFHVVFEGRKCSGFPDKRAPLELGLNISLLNSSTATPFPTSFEQQVPHV